jgi:hypothetical protein
MDAQPLNADPRQPAAGLAVVDDHAVAKILHRVYRRPDDPPKRSPNTVAV